MNVYAFQTDITWEDKVANYENIHTLGERFKPQPGGLIVLPEMFATGFSMQTAVTKEPEDGPSFTFLSEFAQRTQCHVVGGLAIDQGNTRPTNEAFRIDPGGQRLHLYAKLHPFSMGKESQHYQAGSEITQFELPGGLRCCIFICYDLRFPEIFRQAMASEKPPHLFIVIANWPNMRTTHWTRLLEARAIENLAYVVGVNRTGSDPYLSYDGASAIIDPLGKTLCLADHKEQVLQAHVEAHVVDQWRETFPALKDRR